MRLLAVLLGVCLTSFTFAQHTIWSHTIDDTSKPQVTRDASGNFYLATRQVSLLGRKIVVEKFNVLGTKIWSTSQQETSGGLAHQFDVRSIAVGPSLVLVAANVRDGGGDGAFQSSVQMVFNAGNGAFQTSVSSLDEVYLRARSANDFYALLFRRLDGLVGVDMRDNSFGLIDTPTLANNSNDASDMTMDAAGNAYVSWTNTSDINQVSKVTTAGVVAFTTPMDVVGRSEDRTFKVIHDPRTSLLITLTGARRENAPFDRDVFLSIAADNGGGFLNHALVALSTDDEIPGDVFLAQPSGATVAVLVPSGPRVDVVQYNQLVGTPAPLWSAPVGLATGTPLSSLASDADGNVLLLHPFTANAMGIGKLRKTNGLVIDSFTVPGTDVHQLYSDPAGNYYVLNGDSGDVLLRRIQPALLAVPTVPLNGGAIGVGSITLGLSASGDQVWTLTSTNPSAASVPPTATIPSAGSSVNFNITTQPVSSNTTVTIVARFEGFITQRQVTVIPSQLASLSVNPNVVIGGGSSQGIVTVSSPAPTGGMVVNLSSNKPLVASVPANTTVPAASTNVLFAVTTFGVNSNQGVVITATRGAVTKTAFMAVNAPSLTSISVAPGSIKGGTTAVLTLNINGAAPTGGFSIVLFSGAPAVVFAPAAASVNAGQTTRNVSLPTAAVTSSTNVLIFATRSGIFKTATLTVTP
ncbi:MAG: hypothetical protein IT363_12215 [Methanoregulaceae archaeon]|nr:hypothetical protein [Methanoregulaceae archaeon]